MNLRDYERNSIVQFVGQAGMDGHLKGRVLDFGCGRQPYREIVESGGGEYVPYDRKAFGGSTTASDVGDDPWQAEAYWDAILCTQVVQYLPMYPYYDDSSVQSVLSQFFVSLDPGKGHLVMTYPTNWPEVEPEDLHRFTKAGMERLLTEAGFAIVRHEARGVVHDPQFEVGSAKRIRATGEDFVLGYGVIARA